MNPPHHQAVSLYELVTTAEPLLEPVQVSPAIFKAVIGTMIDLLIDHQISATLWVKLPATAAWQDDIQRYCHATSGKVYYLTSPQADSSNLSDMTSLDSVPISAAESVVDMPVEDSDAELSVALESVSLLSADTKNHPILLTLGSDVFRREYFVIVVSDQWCSVVLAHRPRSSQPITDVQAASDPMPRANTGSTDISFLEEPVSERKHPLLLINSLTGETVYQLLVALREVIVTTELHAASPTVVWPDYDACRGLVAQPTWIASLLARQLQHQEELWRQVVSYRRQASTLEALRSQNQALLQELRQKDEFLNNVGQELRTPLTTMKTALTLLNSPTLKPSQRQRYMQLLSSECDRQSSLITSMLDLVQLDYIADHDCLQPVQIIDIIPGVVSTYQPLAQERGLMLAYTIPEDLPAVLCLPTWLRQITVNLLHNAIKFTLAGGRVWVKARPQGDYVQIEFQDSGVGIPAHEIPKIFDRFYRVRHADVDDVSGVGLGLTIVQQILLRCGGSISVKSRVDEGSTFNVLLPIAKTPNASP